MDKPHDSLRPIQVATHGRVGLITLHRPRRLNALNDALMDELGAALKLKFPRRQREFSFSINDLRWIAGLGF